MSITSNGDPLEDSRRWSRSPSSGRLPRPQVDLPSYQERDPYPITGYADIPVDVSIEGMVHPTQYLRSQQPELVQIGAAGGGPSDEPSDGSSLDGPRHRKSPRRSSRRDDNRRDEPEHPPDRGLPGGRPLVPPGGDTGRGPPG